MPQKRQISAADIVDCAIDLMAEVGFARFSALQVAKAYGIRQSHLTYYFPSRDDLLAAMSERLTKRYEDLVSAWCLSAMQRSANPMADLIDQLILDAVSPPTSILFPALWEAANKDSNMAAALDRIYYSSQARLIEMLGADPAAPESRRLREVIQMLATVIEGCTGIYGRRGPHDGEVTQLRETVKDLLLPAFKEALERIPNAKSAN